MKALNRAERKVDFAEMERQLEDLEEAAREARIKLWEVMAKE